VLASLAVGLLLCEIGVRVFGTAPVVYSAGLRDSRSAYRVSENPILGYEMKPGYRGADAVALYTFDGMHPNPLGVRVAAEGISAAIESSPDLFY
jgi:hypothetical protein